MPHVAGHGRGKGPSRSQQRISKPKPLVSKPSSRQPGIGQSNTSKPKPKKQNVKSLMTSDTAYKVDTPKKKSTTAVKFDDNTPDKGQQSVKSSKELGEKRLKKALEIVESNYNVDRRLKDGKYGGNLQKSLDAAQKRFNRLDLTDPLPVKTETKSKSRALMEKLGIPLQTRNYIYDLFIGGKLGSTERRANYKPLSISDFNESQKNNLKNSLSSAVVNKHGFLKLNSPVVFTPMGDNLYHTLGSVSGYINSAGEVIVNDFTDFFGGYSIDTVNEKTGEIENTFTSDDTSYFKWAQNTIKGTAQILDGTYDYNNEKVNTDVEDKISVSFLDRVNNLSAFLVYDVAKALTNLEGTQEEDYPSKVSELKQVTPIGVTELNLGKVNLGGTN
jgi:hypothetical protein